MFYSIANVHIYEINISFRGRLYTAYLKLKVFDIIIHYLLHYLINFLSFHKILYFYIRDLYFWLLCLSFHYSQIFQVDQKTNVKLGYVWTSVSKMARGKIGISLCLDLKNVSLDRFNVLNINCFNLFDSTK